MNGRVMMLHGTEGSIVPVGQSRISADRFSSCGKENYVLNIRSGEEHEYIWGPDRKAAIESWNSILGFIENPG